MVQWDFFWISIFRYPSESDELEASEGEDVSRGALDYHSVGCWKVKCYGESR